MPTGRRPALFVDREGTLIHDAGYPRDPGVVRLLDGAAEALGRLKGLGFALVVVSNQSGVGRGLVTPDEARRVHEAFAAVLSGRGVVLDGSYYCPHAPAEGCACRKPSPGMLLRAADDLNLDAIRSFMVGDKASDIEAGRRAKCRTILFCGDWPPGEHEPSPGVVASDWAGVLREIEGHLKARR